MFLGITICVLFAGQESPLKFSFKQMAFPSLYGGQIQSKSATLSSVTSDLENEGLKFYGCTTMVIKTHETHQQSDGKSWDHLHLHQGLKPSPAIHLLTGIPNSETN